MTCYKGHLMRLMKMWCDLYSEPSCYVLKARALNGKEIWSFSEINANWWQWCRKNCYIGTFCGQWVYSFIHDNYRWDTEKNWAVWLFFDWLNGFQLFNYIAFKLWLKNSTYSRFIFTCRFWFESFATRAYCVYHKWFLYLSIYSHNELFTSLWLPFLNNLIWYKPTWSALKIETNVT